MRRFFAEIRDGFAYVSQEEKAHIKKVLRMNVSDEFIAIDGSEHEYICTILCMEPFSARVIKTQICTANPSKTITLYCASLKADKMEWVLQKCVEIGIKRFVPFISERCVKLPKNDKFMLRMRKIADEAIKQCTRSDIVEILPPIGFNELLSRLKMHEKVIFAYEQETAPIKEVLSSTCSDVAIIIGSEGGFTQSEARSITQAGAHSVSLGKRILRAETAAIYATSLVAYMIEC